MVCMIGSFDDVRRGWFLLSGPVGPASLLMRVLARSFCRDYEILNPVGVPLALASASKARAVWAMQWVRPVRFRMNCQFKCSLCSGAPYGVWIAGLNGMCMLTPGVI